MAAHTNRIAYALTERDGKTYWNKIGIAFTNRDGSLTVKLDAFPVSGTLQIREDEPRDRERERDPDDRDAGRRR